MRMARAARVHAHAQIVRSYLYAYTCHSNLQDAVAVKFECGAAWEKENTVVNIPIT